MEEHETIPPSSSVMPVTTGLADNVAGALAYVTFIPPLLFLVVEPYSRRPFVRFHSFQSIGLCLVWIVVSMVWVFPVVGWMIGAVLHLILFCAWVLCVVKAYRGELFALPLLGKFSNDLTRKGL